MRSAMPVQTLSGNELNTLNAANIADIAKHFAGVTVKDYGGIGGMKTVAVRGLGAQHTGVCYDGVMMSDVQSGQIDLSQFSLENISNVSIFNGQPSDILQPARMFASASVLSFSSKMPAFNPTHTFSGNISTKVGSFGMYNPSISIVKNFSKKVGIRISANGLRANGEYKFLSNLNSNGQNYVEKTRINAFVKTLRTEQNLIYQIADYESISLKTNQYYSKRGLPGADIFYTSNATQGLLDKNFLSQIQYENKKSCYFQYVFAAKYSNAFTQYSDANTNYSTFPNQQREDNYTQKEYYLTSAVQYHASKNLVVSSSLDWSKNGLHSNSNVSFLEDANPVRNTQLANIAAKYVDEKLTVGANLLYTFCHETTKTGAPAPDRNKLTPTASISYKLLPIEDLRIRAFYKKIFRLPTFTDAYYHDFGFKNLLPENTNQFNIGLTYSETKNLFFNEVQCSLDAYYNHITDKITVVYGMPFSSVRNIGLVDIRGADLNLKLRKQIHANINLQFALNYSFQSTNDKDPNSSSFGNSLPYTPEHSGSTMLSVEYKKWEMGYNLLYAGTRNTGSINTSTLKPKLLTPYGDHSIYCKYNIGKFLLLGEVLNITNTHYNIIDFYPMPGINYRISINYKI